MMKKNKTTKKRLQDEPKRPKGASILQRKKRRPQEAKKAAFPNYLENVNQPPRPPNVFVVLLNKKPDQVIIPTRKKEILKPRQWSSPENANLLDYVIKGGLQRPKRSWRNLPAG